MRKLIVFLMVLALIFMSVTLGVFGAYVNVGPTTDFQGDVGTTGVFKVNGTQIAFGDVTNALGVTMANLGSTAINADLIPDSADDTDLGSATFEWNDIYIGDNGKLYLGIAQDVDLQRSASGILTITATNGVVLTAGLTVGSDIVSDAPDTDNLGHADYEWKEIYVSDAGHIYLGSAQDTNLQRTGSGILTITAANGVVTSAKLTVTGELIPASADGAALGSTDREWSDIFLHDDAYIKFGAAQDVTIQRNAANELTITASTKTTISGPLDVGGVVTLTANDVTTTGAIGRDAQNELGWGVDDSLAIVISGVTHNIVSITDGAGDNDKLVTQGYVDTAVSGAGNFFLQLMDIDAASTDYVHLAITGTGSGQDVSTVITNPDYGRNITVTTTNNNTPSGDVTITGTLADGTTSATDVITISAGGTAQGVKAFVYVSNINVPAGVPVEDEVEIGIGDIIGLPNAVSAEADVYMLTVDGVEEYDEISGNVDTTNNTLDVSTINQNEDISVLYHG